MTPADDLRTLFDILTQYESYSEIAALKDSRNLRKFGFPLQDEASEPTTSLPLLNLLIQRFVLTLPGLRDVGRQFWTRDVTDLVSAVADASLSESYDKGNVGIRKTVSLFIASLVEEVSRGILGGFNVAPVAQDHLFDTSNPKDLEASFNELMRQFLYEDAVQKLILKVSKTRNLADHTPVVQAAHKYAVMMISSSLHYMLIHAPQGKSMLDLLKSVNDLIPYFLIRQTLKIGNVASMINAMVKIVLVKMSMPSLSSLFGASDTGSGMNLLQYIISTVLGWDISTFQKTCSAIEHEQKSISKSQFNSIKAYAQKSANDQDLIRQQSVDNKELLVQSILAVDNIPNLDDENHPAGLQYLSWSLAINDREKLIGVLCRNQPDLLTCTVRSLVTAYEPIIRALHKAVDLSGSLADLQTFLSELIILSNRGKGDSQKGTPTVEDYYHLLDKHAPKFHKFLHEACKNSVELKEWYQDYANKALAQYRQGDPASDTMNAAGDFTDILEEFMAKLSAVDKTQVEGELKRHKQELSALADASFGRLETMVHNLLEGHSNTQMGPGIYLAKWQQFMQAGLAAPREKDQHHVEIRATHGDIGVSEPRPTSSSLRPESFNTYPTTIDRIIPLFRHRLWQSASSGSYA